MELSLLAEDKGKTWEGCSAFRLHNRNNGSQSCSPKISFCQGRAKPEGMLTAPFLRGRNWGKGMNISQVVGSAGDAMTRFRRESDNPELKGSLYLTVTPPNCLSVCVRGRNVTSVITQMNMPDETELFLQGSIQLAWDVWSDYASIYKSSMNQWSYSWRRQYILSHLPLHSGLLLTLLSVI